MSAATSVTEAQRLVDAYEDALAAVASMSSKLVRLRRVAAAAKLAVESGTIAGTDSQLAAAVAQLQAGDLP